MAALTQLTLVIGGAASGKSAFAEGLVRAATQDRVYIASAQAFDEEMRAKIARHREDRAADGWQTLEAPLDVAGALSGLTFGQAALFDCATMWLSNHILAEKDWQEESATLLAALSASPAPVVVVSNETGQGIVPDNALARQFRQAQGELNQMLAAQADLVVTVIAGLPLVLKGQLP